jgi:predicted transporter
MPDAPFGMLPPGRGTITTDAVRVGIFIVGWKAGAGMGFVAGFMAAILLAGWVL